MNPAFGKEYMRNKRKEQSQNLDKYTHPEKKKKHLEDLMQTFYFDNVLEVYGGDGNLTEFYKEYCKNVVSLTKYESTYKGVRLMGNSEHDIHIVRGIRSRGNKNTQFNLIDIDGFGYPCSHLRLVFQMMRDTSLLILTIPGKNKIVPTMIRFWNVHFNTLTSPTTDDITKKLEQLAAEDNYGVEYINEVSLTTKGTKRIAYKCHKLNTCKITGQATKRKVVI